MKKQIIAFLLAVVLLLAALPMVLAEDEGPEGAPMTVEEMMGIDMSKYPKTMYVKTNNGGRLNVRREPKSGKNVSASTNTTRTFPVRITRHS